MKQTYEPHKNIDTEKETLMRSYNSICEELRKKDKQNTKLKSENSGLKKVNIKLFCSNQLKAQELKERNNSQSNKENNHHQNISKKVVKPKHETQLYQKMDAFTKANKKLKESEEQLEEIKRAKSKLKELHKQPLFMDHSSQKDMKKSKDF